MMDKKSNEYQDVELQEKETEVAEQKPACSGCCCSKCNIDKQAAETDGKFKTLTELQDA